MVLTQSELLVEDKVGWEFTDCPPFPQHGHDGADPAEARPPGPCPVSPSPPGLLGCGLCMGGAGVS